MKVKQLIVHESEPRDLYAISNDAFVTFNHRILWDGIWRKAGHVLPRTAHENVAVFHIIMDSDEPLDEMMSAETERSFTLSNGIVAHNAVIVKNQN